MIKCLCASIVLVLTLASSAYSSHTPEINASTPYVLGTMHAMPDGDDDVVFKPVILYPPGGGITMFRRRDKEHYAFEHYASDALGLEWETLIPVEKKDAWNPTLAYRNGKLYASGIEIFSDKDSTGLRTIAVDPTTHRILSDVWAFREEHEYRHGLHFPTHSDYFSAFSSDGSKAAYFWHRPSGQGMEGLLYAVRVYDVTGQLLDTITINHPFPEFMQDPRALMNFESSGTFGLQIDNGGNLYIASVPTPVTLRMMKFSHQAMGSPKVLEANFPLGTLEPEYRVAVEYFEIDTVTGSVRVVGSHVKGGRGTWMKDLLYADLNFTASRVQTFVYLPTEEQLDALIDQSSFKDFDIARIIRDEPTGSIILIADKRITSETVVSWRYSEGIGAMHSSWKTYYSSYAVNYCNGFALFGFSADGKPVFQHAFPSKPDKRTDYYFAGPTDSKLGVYYSDHKADPEGLQYRELDLHTGALLPAKNVLTYETDSYILSGYTHEESPKSLLMIAATGDADEMKFHQPMMFRVSLP